MADAEEMHKKFLEGFQKSQKQTVDSLAETREVMRLLAEKLQNSVSIEERGSSSEVRQSTSPLKNAKPIFIPEGNSATTNPPPNPIEELARELVVIKVSYDNQDEGFKNEMPYNNYVTQMQGMMNLRGYRLQQEQHGGELKSKINKLSAPTFDGSNKISAKAWLQKLQTYFTLCPMKELDAIQYATLHLEGTTYA